MMGYFLKHIIIILEDWFNSSYLF